MKEAKSEANRRWRAAHPDYYAQRRVAILTALGPRFCEECGMRLPVDSQRAKRFCSRKCINDKSVRERFEQRKMNQRKHRAVLYGAEVLTLSQADWNRLVNRFDGMCAYCREKPYFDMDHVIPLGRGGRHAIGNVLPACRSCNTLKGSRLLAEWRAER